MKINDELKALKDIAASHKVLVGSPEKFNPAIYNKYQALDFDNTMAAYISNSYTTNNSYYYSVQSVAGPAQSVYAAQEQSYDFTSPEFIGSLFLNSSEMWDYIVLRTSVDYIARQVVNGVIQTHLLNGAHVLPYERDQDSEDMWAYRRVTVAVRYDRVECFRRSRGDNKFTVHLNNADVPVKLQGEFVVAEGRQRTIQNA